MTKIALLALGATALTANAGLTFATIQGDTLHRTSGGLTTQSTLADSFHSLSFIQGQWVGASNTGEGPGPGGEITRNVYSIDNLFAGAASINFEAQTLDFPITTLFERNNGDVIGINSDGLHVLDANFAATSTTPFTAAAIAVGGTAYDAVTDTLYGIDSLTDTLVSINIDTGMETTIGSLGFDAGNQGGQFFNGEYYTAVENLDTGELVIGTVDLGDGSFTQLEVVTDQGIGTLGNTIGFAVIPAPSSAAVLGLGGLLAARRRR